MTQSLTEPDSVEYRQLFEGLNDPCVVFEIVDGEPIIVSANTPFEETFVGPNEAVSGVNLNELIVPDDDLDQAQELDERTKCGATNGVEVERETTHGIRHFLYRGIPLDNGLGFGIYIDVTRRRREQEYIDVLQRILRHNLRNDLSVIRGFARRASDITTDDELSTCLSKILDKTSRIENLTEEADTIRDIINEDFEPDTQSVVVEDVVGSAIGSCLSEFSNANIGIECTDKLTVRAGEKLQVAFESVIDNGLRYNDADQPTVMIRGHQVGNNRAHISIADNGTGIGPTERKVITGEKEVTPLDHGSGLGLWVTKWVIESYQGTIDIHNLPTGGTVVEFWLNA
jgi:signal transduction histidine kinase